MPVLPLHLTSLPMGRSTYTFTWSKGPLTTTGPGNTPWQVSPTIGAPIPEKTAYGLYGHGGVFIPIPLQPAPSAFRQGDEISLVTATRQESGLTRPVMLVNHTRTTREIFAWAPTTLIPAPVKMWQIFALHLILLVILSVLGTSLNMQMDPFLFAVPVLLGLSLILRKVILSLRGKALLGHVAAIQDVVIDQDLDRFLQLDTAPPSFSP